MLVLPAAVLVGTLAVISNVEAAKCPRVCTCDSAKLTVACVGKNLTGVPPTIDEVRNRCLPPRFNLTRLLFLQGKLCRSIPMRPIGIYGLYYVFFYCSVRSIKMLLMSNERPEGPVPVLYILLCGSLKQM